MKHKVIWQLVVPLLGLCVLFMLLATEPAKVQARQEPVEISVILRETESGTWSATRQGMEQAAMDLNVELRVLTLSRENDAEEQRDLLEREVASGADGVLLIPADREVLSEAVETAADAVPVVTMETDMSQDGASGYISVDNDALGRMLGDIALNGAPEGSSVLLLSGVSEATGISDRLTAAQEVLEAAGRKVYRCVLRPEESLESVLEGELAALAPAAVVAFDTSTLERDRPGAAGKGIRAAAVRRGVQRCHRGVSGTGCHHGGGGPQRVCRRVSGGGGAGGGHLQPRRCHGTAAVVFRGAQGEYV